MWSPSRFASSARARLCIVALLALWLGGQQLSAEHERAHAHHDTDCAAYLAAAAPLAIAAALLPPVRLGGVAATVPLLLLVPTRDPRAATAGCARFIC
jgi:hypothetical protein